jgi:hypothetical protein
VRHHAERCGVILSHTAREAMTGYQLVGAMWHRLAPFHQHFAVLEILAHLDLLERRGQVAGEERDGGALYWSAKSSASA